MAKSDDKHKRLQQLIYILKSHPEGLRKAEIARRLGVHRSTVGRYIDHLSLHMHVWERDSHVGIENSDRKSFEPAFNIHEGAFIFSLFKLYRQEINIRNPNASSVMRKLSEYFKTSAAVLSESFLETAEDLDIDEAAYYKDYVEILEKLTLSWINSAVVSAAYVHKSNGESCSMLFEPKSFFTKRNSYEGSELAVCGVCKRTGRLCCLLVSEFSSVVYPLNEQESGADSDYGFCPVSEYALSNLPSDGWDDCEGLTIRESNHRIKNSLFMASGLVDITFAGVDDPALKPKIRNLQSRIDTIALIHDQLSQRPGADTVELKSFIEDLVAKTVAIASADHESVKTRLKIDAIPLRSAKALPLGMIIAELVTNSFKHSPEEDDPVIVITLTGVSGVIRMRYSDGGSGFRLGAETVSNGSSIMKNFCRQLDCTISYKKNIFLLEFPK